MNNFGYDSKFLSIANKIADAFFAGILWVLFSFPIITFGTAATALYYTIHKSLRGNRGYVWRSFWKAFRSNFKQTTIIWLLMLAVFAFLFVDYRIMLPFLKQGSPAGWLCYVFLLLMLFWVVWCIYIFAYSARFEGGMKATMKNAAMIALLNLPWSLAVLTLLLAGLLLVYLLPVLILFVPVGICCVYDMFLEKVFRKYMSEQDLKKEEELDWGRSF